MKELYEYLSTLRSYAYAHGKRTVEVDQEHLFELHRMMCYLLQIRAIINFEDEIAMKRAGGEDA